MDVVLRFLLNALVPYIGRPFVNGDFAVAEWWRRQQSNGWPIVSGHVQNAQIYFKDPLWVTELSYSYSVNGEFYAGYIGRHFARERDADEYLERFPIGMAVFIRHKTNKPEVSLLRQDDQMGMGAYAAR
jgi:hypothetical protein